MKQQLVSIDTPIPEISRILTVAVEAVARNTPLGLMSEARRRHFIERIAIFTQLTHAMMRSTSKTIQLCICYEGESLNNPTYLEAQLVDKKNETVYAAVILDDK